MSISGRRDARAHKRRWWRSDGKIYCVIALTFRLAFVSSQTSVWRAHGTEKNISNAVCTLGECFVLRAASSSPSDLLRSSIAREEIQKNSSGPKATREISSLATANGSRPRRLCASMFFFAKSGILKSIHISGFYGSGEGRNRNVDRASSGIAELIGKFVDGLRCIEF